MAAGAPGAFGAGGYTNGGTQPTTMSLSRALGMMPSSAVRQQEAAQYTTRAPALAAARQRAEAAEAARQQARMQQQRRTGAAGGGGAAASAPAIARPRRAVQAAPAAPTGPAVIQARFVQPEVGDSIEYPVFDAPDFMKPGVSDEGGIIVGTVNTREVVGAQVPLLDATGQPTVHTAFTGSPTQDLFALVKRAMPDGSMQEAIVMAYDAEARAWCLTGFQW